MTQPSLSDEDDDVEKEIINGENGKKKRKKGSTKSAKPWYIPILSFFIIPVL